MTNQYLSLCLACLLLLLARQPDAPPTSSERGSPEGGVDPSPRSCESDIFVLSPPYLVPRPAVFPVPTLTVCVISAHNLKVGTNHDS